MPSLPFVVHPSGDCASPDDVRRALLRHELRAMRAKPGRVYVRTPLIIDVRGR